MWKKTILVIVSFIFFTGCISKPKSDLDTFKKISGWAAYSLQNTASRADIFIKDLESGEITQLTNSGLNRDPKWSPDGSKILFQSLTDEGQIHVYVIDKDGKNLHPIIASAANEITAAWSPDGKKVVYISDIDKKIRIYVIDLQTQKIINLTKDFPINTGALDWSPNGKRILFVSTMEYKITGQIFIMDADGTNVHQITSDLSLGDAPPVWCPNSSCIIYTSDQPQIMSLDLGTLKVSPLIDSKFSSEKQISSTGRSPVKGYITFSVDGIFYALDINTQDTYSLEINAMELSLFP